MYPFSVTMLYTLRPSNGIKYGIIIGLIPCHGLTPAGILAAHSCSLTPPTAGWGREAKGKSYKTQGLKQSLIGKAKVARASKVK